MKQECKHYYSRDQNSIAIINTEDSVSGGFCPHDRGDFVHLAKLMRGVLSTLS